MRTLALALMMLFPILGFAMPSASDISNVESLVNELLPAGAKPAERAASAVKLAGQAETEAAKYLLLRTAFLSYVKAGEYEKAEEAFDALLEAVPDFPLGDQEDLFSKAMFSVPSKGAPNLRARQAAIKGQVKQLSVVKRIQASIDKNPANKALYARLGESYVILNDWPKALAAFSKASDPVLAATATHELELKPGAGTASSSLMKFADYWWDYSSKSPELIAAMRSHAVALYKLSLPTLTGLNKVRVEKRIKEADEAAVVRVSKDSKVPYEKTIAALKGDGLSYIDLGVPVDLSRTKIEIDQTIVLTSASTFGVNPFVAFTFGGGKLRFRYNSETVDVAGITGRVVLTMDKNNVYIAGKKVGTFNKSNSVTQNTAFLFARRSAAGEAEECTRNQIHSFKMWKDNKLQLDMIPIVADGVGCMYDKVSKRIFVNKGTGKFAIKESE